MNALLSLVAVLVLAAAAWAGGYAEPLRPALGSFQAWPPESDAQRAGRAALLQRFDELFVRK